MTDIIKSRTDVRIPITLTIYNNMIFIHIEGMKSQLEWKYRGALP